MSKSEPLIFIRAVHSPGLLVSTSLFLFSLDQHIMPLAPSVTATHTTRSYLRVVYGEGALARHDTQNLLYRYLLLMFPQREHLY